MCLQGGHTGRRRFKGLDLSTVSIALGSISLDVDLTSLDVGSTVR